jgi:hypothetical protein
MIRNLFLTAAALLVAVPAFAGHGHKGDRDSNAVRFDNRTGDDCRVSIDGIYRADVQAKLLSDWVPVTADAKAPLAVENRCGKTGKVELSLNVTEKQCTVAIELGAGKAKDGKGSALTASQCAAVCEPVKGDDGKGDVKGDDGKGGDVKGDDGKGAVNGDDGKGDVKGDDGKGDQGKPTDASDSSDSSANATIPGADPVKTTCPDQTAPVKPVDPTK